MLLYRTGLDWSAWEATVTRRLARAMGAKWAQAAALCLAALAAAAALDCFPCDVPDGCATTRSLCPKSRSPHCSRIPA